MNKKYQDFIPFCYLLAAIILLAIVFLMCKPKIDEYMATLEDIKRNNETKQQLEEQANREKLDRADLENKLKSLKSIYKSEVKSSVENLSIFGTMFEDIIKKAQMNGLLIRSIEYNMKPVNDVLYTKYTKYYNACELKFFFVATYGQLQEFLNDVNKNFDYLTSLSEVKVTAFEENPDYLLAKISIVLYSEKQDD